MLIEFSVKNFLSFKNKVTLSMEKGNGDENLDNIISTNNVDLLKTAAIYGANASGKSNLIKAFTFAILFVRNSNNNTVGMRLPIINSFMFDAFTMGSPSEFEFDFISNNIRYKYAFSADATKVYTESLDAYYTQKPTNIFTRTNTNEYTFPKTEESKLKSIESKNIENKLFLATATNWNYEKTKDAYLWFVNCIDTYNSFDSISKEVLIDYSNNGELKTFTLNMLKEFDIFIKDLNVSYEEKEMDTNMVNMFIPPAAKTVGTPMVSNVKIELIHEVVDENNNTDTKVQKINGVSKPKISLGVDDTKEHFVIMTSDDEKLEKVEFKLNQDDEVYELNLGNQNTKELNYRVPFELQSGENIIEVTVYNSNNISEQITVRFVK